MSGRDKEGKGPFTLALSVDVYLHDFFPISPPAASCLSPWEKLVGCLVAGGNRKGGFYTQRVVAIKSQSNGLGLLMAFGYEVVNLEMRRPICRWEREDIGLMSEHSLSLWRVNDVNRDLLLILIEEPFYIELCVTKSLLQSSRFPPEKCGGWL